MIHSKIPLAQTVIQLCKLKGIKHIIISPGSRNAPLTIGFTNDPFFECYSIVDERCAAFFALGIAQQTLQPTALVCTSGSALLNYYPAIAEAFYSNIPLLVLSADRPKHLVGIGDGQTINQENVFKNHIEYSANLKEDLNSNLEDNTISVLQEAIQNYNEIEINKAINSAIENKGPIHINIPFDEPLYETCSKLSITPKVIKPSKHVQDIDEVLLQPYIEKWHSASKKMVLVGVNYPNEIDLKWLDKLAQDDSVIVLTETTSNLHHSSFFSSIDTLIIPLNEKQKLQLQPDILLTFGGLIVSKKIKQFLREYKPKHHWHVDSKLANDTFFCLEKHIKTTPNTFFKAFLPNLESCLSDYKETWTFVKQQRIEKHEAYLKTISFSDFIVFNTILKVIPKHYILQSSNSSTIRYTQLFNIDKTIQVFCNRGTSGIDGSTSTAIGCAIANKSPTLLITGDLSFFYDSNALWNNYIPNNFRIIVVNNRGGGIFRILPANKNTENFDTYFETSHNLTAEQLSNMYGFYYDFAANEESLKESLSSFYKESDQPKLLEVFTPSKLNDQILLDYFNYIDV